jgi:iron complex transport system ATP-binding protein
LLEVLNQLEISHLQKRLITELSSGELQRVALATALAPKPPVLILDEPMARIDSKMEINLAKILNDIARHGQSVIIFEHRLDYLLIYADYLILLDSGKIDAQGKPIEIIDKLETVDIPEVSRINWPGLMYRPLSLSQARELLLDKILEN